LLPPIAREPIAPIEEIEINPPDDVNTFLSQYQKVMQLYARLPKEALDNIDMTALQN
jgi:hypothetical protein